MPANVALGLVGAAGKSAEDLGPGAIVASSSFTTPALAPATWVLFRPEGMPLAFDAVCNVGATGSGAGGFYMNAGGRNYAALLMPLGTTRVSGWNEASAQWSN